jgi:hypothetical protein
MVRTLEAQYIAPDSTSRKRMHMTGISFFKASKANTSALYFLNRERVECAEKTKGCRSAALTSS